MQEDSGPQLQNSLPIFRTRAPNTPLLPLQTCHRTSKPSDNEFVFRSISMHK